NLSLDAGHWSLQGIKAPAKLNLRLKITGRRADGYHELVSIMVPVDLFDLLDLRLIPERRIEISCDGFQVPADESNLVHQAARSFFSKAGIQKGVAIKLTKNIPVAAGLGGGSSDAAATLMTLNEICAQPLNLPELHAMAGELGADVPFFLRCEPALATGIGDVLEPLEKWPTFWYVIVTPPIQVSTSWVYDALKLELTRGEYDYIVKFLKNDPFAVSAILENDLEEVTSSRFPIIDTIKAFLMNAGAEGALMTGSGPSVFGVFSSLNQALSAKQFLISQSLGDVFVATNWEGPKH
ncbi:MAG: 4-(cytidine 5'-diphospho)-2-C-methyl-D-erythritol kinase, partial [Desulfobacteraceae bacterium]